MLTTRAHRGSPSWRPSPTDHRPADTEQLLSAMTPGERVAFLRAQAQARLAAAVDGLEVTVDEQRTLDWLPAFEVSMADHVASLIEKAREAKASSR